MSAAIAVIAMLGSMIAMGVSESNSKNGVTDELEIVEETTDNAATILRDVNALEKKMAPAQKPQQRAPQIHLRKGKLR